MIVDAAIARCGRIDALVNNAGVGSPEPLDETDDPTLDSFLDIMLVAPFRLCRDVIPHLKDSARVVNVTSTFAHIGGWRGGCYSAAKGGLKSLTEHMACEYGPGGIRSNCVAPGVTMTDMVAHRFEDGPSPDRARKHRCGGHRARREAVSYRRKLFNTCTIARHRW